MTIDRRTASLQVIAGAFLGALQVRNSSAQAVTQYTYDALGRLVQVAYPNGDTVQYSYDSAGNRTQVVRTAQGPGGTLSVNPTTITQGNSATLSWTSNNATSVVIDHGVGSVTPVAGGSVSVSPLVTTTYTATITGPGGSVQRQATLTVNASGFNQTIQITGTGPVNLRTLANTAGYNGAQNANVIFEVGSGVTITGAAGAPNGGIAIDSGTWPTGSYTIVLSLVVKSGGIVRGGGGRGGEGGSFGSPGNSGGAGGDAVYCRLPMSITFESGSQARGGGAGGGGGASSEMGWPEPETGGGGGGGGGAPNGPGGAGGYGNSNGNPGSAGTTSAGGAGGSGVGANGGLGGNYAATGANGGSWISPPISGGSGGAGGYCVRKNGHAVGVTNNGSTSGAIG